MRKQFSPSISFLMGEIVGFYEHEFNQHATKWPLVHEDLIGNLGIF